MEKIIGIYGWSTGENSFGVTKTYLDFASKFGKVRILTPDNTYDSTIDLLLLTGGMDLNPSSYGAFPEYYAGNIDVFKQHVYDNCLPNYIGNKPIFGICLGFQQLCTFFGSKLTQHLPYHKQSEYRGKDAHDVSIIDNDLKSKFGKKFKVNSHHHQGVLLKDLSTSLSALFIAENEDMSSFNTSIVEGIKHKDLPIIGVQSHPEEFYSYAIYSLFKSLLDDQC